MKEIIYLDTGLLHSYLAQYNDGLPTGTNREREEQVYDSSEKTFGHESQSAIEAIFKTGNFEIPLVFKSPEGEFKGTFKPGKFASDKSIMSQTETGKEIISKQLHDNALASLEKHLNDEEIVFNLDTEDLEGKFVKFTSHFKIIDFKHIRKMLQPEKLLTFMFNDVEEEIAQMDLEFKQMKEGMEKKDLRSLLRSRRDYVTELKKSFKEEYNKIANMLDYILDILPNDAFIIAGDNIAPLKSEYLRESANELTFKYGGTKLQITLLGKVTSKVNITNADDFSGNDPFFDLPKILNLALQPIGVVKQGDLIISPIAIYFE